MNGICIPRTHATEAFIDGDDYLVIHQSILDDDDYSVCLSKDQVQKIYNFLRETQYIT